MAEEIENRGKQPVARGACLLSLRGLTRRFGGLTAVDGIDLDLAKGELVSIIGPNGAGKTTLFNLVTGLDRPDGGEVRLDGETVIGLSPEKLAAFGVARTFQLGRVFGNLSVIDNVLIGAHTRLRAVKPATPLIGPLLELGLALLRPASVKAEEEQLREEAKGILARFGDRLLPRIDQPAYSLSYANRRRIEIARALALRPRLMLLDEPTAGMNPTETTEMQALVAEMKAEGLTILLIEHKLDMVMRLSDRVIVMDEGRKIAEGAGEDVRKDAKVIEAYLGHGLSQAAADERETAA
jgi:branched-chain amino acid transport system ATP-binding protein